MRRYALPAALAVAFAVHTALSAALTGRAHAPAFVLALSAAAFAVALVASGRPVAAVRSLDRRGLLLASCGGALAVFGAPALVAANRMADAPSGSVTVFWTAGGWAAVAALWAAVAALRQGRRSVALGAVAGAGAVLAGSAAVLANWERPSSFSPLVKFAEQEALMLLAGVALVAGVGLLSAAGRRGRPFGALAVGSATALVASAVWFLVGGVEAGAATLKEMPLELTLAGFAWGLVLVTLPALWRDEGAASAASCLALAPVVISALTWLEQAVGASGPQPMILTGVAAGSLLVIAGAVRLRRCAARTEAAPAPRLPVVVAGAAPAVLAVAGLALPALRVDVTHQRDVGAAVLQWVLPGAESVAVMAALALALLLLAAVFDDRPAWTAGATLAACVAWPVLLDVPTHVIVRWLSPAIQQDYGTEYATITFTRIWNMPATAAVAFAAAGSIVLIVSRHMSGAGPLGPRVADTERS